MDLRPPFANGYFLPSASGFGWHERQSPATDLSLGSSAISLSDIALGMGENGSVATFAFGWHAAKLAAPRKTVNRTIRTRRNFMASSSHSTYSLVSRCL